MEKLGMGFLSLLVNSSLKEDRRSCKLQPRRLLPQPTESNRRRPVHSRHIDLVEEDPRASKARRGSDQESKSFEVIRLSVLMPEGITIDGKVRSHTSTYSLHRRTRDGYVDVKRMFRIAFPDSVDGEEQDELAHIGVLPRIKFDRLGKGFWVPAETALQLAERYGIERWVKALMDGTSVEGQSSVVVGISNVQPETAGTTAITTQPASRSNVDKSASTRANGHVSGTGLKRFRADLDLAETILKLIDADTVKLKGSTKLQIRYEIQVALDWSEFRVQRAEEMNAKLSLKLDELEGARVAKTKE